MKRSPTRIKGSHLTWWLMDLHFKDHPSHDYMQYYWILCIWYVYIYYNYTQYMFFIDIYLYTICHRHVYEKLGKVRHLKWWCKKWWALESLKIANLDDIELAKKLHMDIWHMGKTLVWDEFPSILCLMGKNRPSYTRCYSPVIYKLVYNPH